MNLTKWLCYQYYTLFFDDFPAWLEIAPIQGPLIVGGVSLMDVGDTALLQEYDDLFKGTDADIYFPLWASACKNNGDFLLDQTTLDVVRFYHAWGYAPWEMDGNPPDFIGQQLRFLAYLAACALHEEKSGGSPHLYEEAAEQFVRLFMLDTVRAVAQGMETHAVSPVFGAVAQGLRKLFAGEYPPTWTEPQRQTAEAALLVSPFAAVAQKGRQAPIPNGQRRIVNTAGRNNCGGKCVIRATVEDGCVLNITSDVSDNDPQIRACVRGRGYRKTYLSGKRLRYPMKRRGERGQGKFQRITWEEAADIVAGEWARIRDAYGPGSRFVLYSTGVSAVLRPDDMAKRLLNLDGGYLAGYNTYSSACARYITPYIYGDNYSGNSVEDMMNAKLLIMWGHNPAETIFGSLRNYQTAKAKEAGIKVIVIDPRLSDTAASCGDEWIGIKPSTDSALADGMAYVIWSEGLQDQQFMDTYCLGFDEGHMPAGVPEGLSYKAYLFGEADGIPKTPRWAETITGVPADTIARIAREYATAKPACLLPGLGIQRTGNGEQTVRSVALLTCLTGNVGTSGGGAAGANAVKEHKAPFFPTLPNPFGGKIPTFLWTRAIEHAAQMNRRDDGLEGVAKLNSNIKMLLNLAGNTLINQHSDINNSIRILKDTGKCEFILGSDVFMTASARFADVLLPAPSFLEDDNISAPWDYGPYLLYNNRVIPPVFGCRFEYDLLRDVARRLGLGEQWEAGHGAYTDWLKALYEDLRQRETQLPEFAVFQRNGGYSYRDSAPFIAYQQQIREHTPFATPSGKIEIFSQRLFDRNNPAEIPGIPCYVPCAEGPGDPLAARYPLQLIGWHTKRRCHSIHDNNDWLEEVEPQRMWMHPADAEARGIVDGALVEVFNGRGRIRMPVYVTPRIIQGVVAIPQGGWYTPDKSGVDTRGSINVLTSTKPTPIARGNPQHTNLVEVVAMEAQ